MSLFKSSLLDLIDSSELIFLLTSFQIIKLLLSDIGILLVRVFPFIFFLLFSKIFDKVNLLSIYQLSNYYINSIYSFSYNQI